MTLRYRFALLFALSFVPALLAACAPGVLASVLGIASTVAPIATSALGAYEQAAHDAQTQAGLPASDPLVVAMRDGFAALAAADAKAIAASQPVACSEPVPVGAPLPPPAVDTAALDAALDVRLAKAVAAQMALRKVRAKKTKPAVATGVDAGSDDAGKDGGA